MDDLISRQALCRYALNQKDKSITPNDIMRFPSAEPKIGRWILTPMLPDIHRYKCSNCMSHHRARYEFCPSCGVKMVSCEKCKHWESDTGYCYEIANSNRHECNFEQI